MLNARHGLTAQLIVDIPVPGEFSILNDAPCVLAVINRIRCT